MQGTIVGTLRMTNSIRLWRRGDVADNPAWRCPETRCSYRVPQRGGWREDDDRPGLPRSDILVSPQGLVWLGYKEAHATSAFVQPSCFCLTNSPTLQN